MSVNIAAYRQLFDRGNSAPGQDDEDWRTQMRRRNANANVMVGNDTSAPSDNAPTPGTSITRPPAADDPTNEEVLADAASATPNIVKRPVSPLEAARQDAENQYVSAIRSPIQKQAWWKDALVKAAQVANNIFNPRNPVPIEGWGTVKHNKMVGDAAKVLGPLQQQYDTDIASRAKQAQTENIATDNERQAQELQLKRDTEDRKREYYNRQADNKRLATLTAQELAEARILYMGKKNANDVRRLDLIEKEMENRNTRAQNALDSRETIAGERNSTTQGIANQRSIERATAVETHTAEEQRKTLAAFDMQMANPNLTDAQREALRQGKQNYLNAIKGVQTKGKPGKITATPTVPSQQIQPAINPR